jgi:nitrogen regulatory protein P-II 1
MISDIQKGSRIGSTGIKSIPLSKIELVVHDKDAHKVIEVITRDSGTSSKPIGKIFVSEMTEVVDMSTSEADKDLETNPFQTTPYKTTRNRLVSLQKHTLARVERIYEENKETLMVNYRVKSFNDFVNHCVATHLKIMERQLKHPEIIYDNKF